jgi:hypothetical protein
MADYEEGARQMQAAGQGYRLEAINGRMILYLADGRGGVVACDLPIECMVSIGRDILRLYDYLLAAATEDTSF